VGCVHIIIIIVSLWLPVAFTHGNGVTLSLQDFRPAADFSN